MSIHRAQETLDAEEPRHHPREARLQDSSCRPSPHQQQSEPFEARRRINQHPRLGVGIVQQPFPRPPPSRSPAAVSRHALSYFLGYFCTVEGVGSAHRPICNQSWHDRRGAQAWPKRKKTSAILHSTHKPFQNRERTSCSVWDPTNQGSRVGPLKHLTKTCFVELIIVQFSANAFASTGVSQWIILITEILPQLLVKWPKSKCRTLNISHCRRPTALLVEDQIKKRSISSPAKVDHVLCLATHQRHHFSEKAGLGGEEAREAPTKCFHVRRSFSVVLSPTT